MSKKFEDILSNLEDSDRKIVDEKLNSMKANDSAVDDDAFVKAAEKMAEMFIEANKVEPTKGKDGEELKKKMSSFSEDSDNPDAMEKYVKQMKVSKEERLDKYLKAKKEGNIGYVKSVNERIAKYFQALVRNDWPVVKALTEGTDANGGFLVPEEFRAEVIQELQNQTVMRRIATVITMNTDTMDIPTETARPAVRWTNEDTELTTSSGGYGEVTLTPHKLTGRLPVTRELAADSAVPIVQHLTRVFGQELAEAEDKAFFTGSGSGRPKGLEQETLTSVTAGSNKADSLINLMYKLKRAYRSRATWVMNSNTLRNVRKLKDADNQYLWVPGLQNGEAPTILGRPVEEQNDLADGRIFFGDFSYYFIGDREQMSAETTTEGGTAWERDRIEIKVRERVDGTTALTRAFVEGGSF